MTGKFLFVTTIASLCMAAAPGMAAEPAHMSAHGDKATLVYDHVLPNVPGKSIKGVLVARWRKSSGNIHG